MMVRRPFSSRVRQRDALDYGHWQGPGQSSRCFHLRQTETGRAGLIASSKNKTRKQTIVRSESASLAVMSTCLVTCKTSRHQTLRNFTICAAIIVLLTGRPPRFHRSFGRPPLNSITIHKRSIRIHKSSIRNRQRDVKITPIPTWFSIRIIVSLGWVGHYRCGLTRDGAWEGEGEGGLGGGPGKGGLRAWRSPMVVSVTGLVRALKRSLSRLRLEPSLSGKCTRPGVGGLTRPPGHRWGPRQRRHGPQCTAAPAHLSDTAALANEKNVGVVFRDADGADTRLVALQKECAVLRIARIHVGALSACLSGRRVIARRLHRRLACV